MRFATRAPVRLIRESVLSLVGSTVDRNQGDGLHLETSIASVRENTITGNLGFGIFVDAASLAARYANTISGNGTDTSDAVPPELTQPRYTREA